MRAHAAASSFTAPLPAHRRRAKDRARCHAATVGILCPQLTTPPCTNPRRHAKDRARATLARPLSGAEVEGLLGALPAWLAGMGARTERLDWLNKLLADVGACVCFLCC